MTDADDELPRRSKKPLVFLLALVLAGGVTWKVLHPPPKPEPPERTLFRKQLVTWVIAQARHDLSAPDALATCVTAAQPWPEVAKAIEALPAAWNDRDALHAATKNLNRAARASGLAFWVDPQFPDGNPILTTYEVLRRSTWVIEAELPPNVVEVIQVRRLDTLNLVLGLLGHAGGDQPAVLRDRVEMAVLDKLRVDPEDRPNEVDDAAAQLWRDRLTPLVGAAGLAEADRRVNERERLARAMEKRLKGGKIHVARPERLVFGDSYFENLEPYTSNTRRGGPLILASDLRALRRADEALDDSEGLRALLQIIELESEIVEAHEARHELDPREVETPELLQHLVGEDDLRFGKMAERELRAFIGQLHDARPPACLSVVSLAQLARGRHSQSTPHFFAAHALLSTLGQLDGERGLDEDQVIEVMKTLCGLPDDELRKRAAAASETLYGEPLKPAVVGTRQP